MEPTEREHRPKWWQKAGHCSQEVQPEKDTAGACMQQGRRRDGAKQGQVSLSLSLPTYTWNVHLYFKPLKELHVSQLQ